MFERVLQRGALTKSVTAVVPTMFGAVAEGKEKSGVVVGSRRRGGKVGKRSVSRGEKKKSSGGGVEMGGKGGGASSSTLDYSSCPFDATALLLSEKEVQDIRRRPSASASSSSSGAGSSSLGSSRFRGTTGCLVGISLPTAAIVGFNGFLGEQSWITTPKQVGPPSASSSTTTSKCFPPGTLSSSSGSGRGKKGGGAVSPLPPLPISEGEETASGVPSGAASTATQQHPTLLIGLSRRKAERAHLRHSTGAGVGLPPPSSLLFTSPSARRKPLLLQSQSVTIAEYREAVTRAVRAAMNMGPSVETLRLRLPSPCVTVTSAVDLFHPTPYVFSAEELAEKTACFAVTGAYRYRRHKKQGRAVEEGEDEDEDLWEQDDKEEQEDVVGAALDRIGKRGLRGGRFLGSVNNTTTTTINTRGGGGGGGGRSSGKSPAQKRKGVARRAGRGKGGRRGGGRGATRRTSSQKCTGRGGEQVSSEAPGKGLQQVLIDTPLQEDVQTGSVIGNAVNEARDLGNLREDEGTPEFYVDWMLKQMEKKRLHGITVKKILQGSAIEEAGMNMLFNVGKGSVHTPYVTVLEYVGDKKNPEATALVGKGVTFDCGGLNIKSYGSMETMHTDMMGAAAVLTTLQAVATLALPINIVAVVGFVENAIGPQSYHPGCILKSHKGLSVEVRNTDAEGRLVLADLFSYLYSQEETGRSQSIMGGWGDPNGCGSRGRGSAVSHRVTPRRHSFHLAKRPTSLIDLATLTGAITVSLGFHRAGCFSNDAGLSDALMEAGTWCGEELWPMPIGIEHVRAVQGEIADLVNTPAGRGGGSCTAAAFLSHFVPSGVKWAHLDIAGPADVGDRGRGFVHPPGATGFGVQLLMDFLRRGAIPQQDS